MTNVPFEKKNKYAIIHLITIYDFLLDLRDLRRIESRFFFSFLPPLYSSVCILNINYY